MKRWMALGIVLSLLLALNACGARTPVLILDRDGGVIAEYDGTLTVNQDAFAAYARYALAEAADRFAAKEGCGGDKAMDRLMKKGARVRTAADPELIAAAAAAGDDVLEEGVPFSLAVTDDRAGLIAIYSTAGEIAPTYAGSAIKPLSVYAPCVQSGVMQFSSLQEDSPVKMIQTGAGETPWPANGSGEYSGREIPAAEALAASVNTVAVKWLMEYGVTEAMDFLENSFGIDVAREREIVSQLSEEEVYGNLALGYLQSGVTVCGMAGYYRVFAAGGRYTPAYAVTGIVSASGETLYEARPEAKQVLSEQTAWIMNRMLKGVVDQGTGAAARIEGVDLVGKTGTSDGYADNWFVGLTPVNAVAVWHGASSDRPGNRAAALFSAFFQSSGLEAGKTFSPCDGVVRRNYCVQSGLLATGDCPQIEAGYFAEDRLPDECGGH